MIIAIWLPIRTQIEDLLGFQKIWEGKSRLVREVLKALFSKVSHYVSELYQIPLWDVLKSIMYPSFGSLTY